jgi:hypothetical protein
MLFDRFRAPLTRAATRSSLERSAVGVAGASGRIALPSLAAACPRWPFVLVRAYFASYGRPNALINAGRVSGVRSGAGSSDITGTVTPAFA